MTNELMLIERKGKVIVSSRIIAERFGKRHDNTLAAIRELIRGLLENKETPENYFIKSEYKDQQNYQVFPEFLCTRDGFALLAMGFTGDEAFKWKLKYIQAFNYMETLLLERQSTDWLQTREKGKLIRRDETDAIQQLIPYAESQGSKNARMFYINYSRLVNAAVGVESGQREHLPHKKLMLNALIEDMLSHTILEEIERGTYYKNIYQVCKAKVSTFVSLAYIQAS